MGITKNRTPATQTTLAAVAGAVIIHTVDGNVVLSPALARDVAKQLPSLADLANVITEPEPDGIEFMPMLAKGAIQ
ncbi:MAG: hypothetical protein P4L50_03095 [Anaerolineaceae bacterium]|nr:hypothetical protein [Anaerolineaceae bacterium]